MKDKALLVKQLHGNLAKTVSYDARILNWWFNSISCSFSFLAGVPFYAQLVF